MSSTSSPKEVPSGPTGQVRDSTAGRALTLHVADPWTQSGVSLEHYHMCILPPPPSQIKSASVCGLFSGWAGGFAIQLLPPRRWCQASKRSGPYPPPQSLLLGCCSAPSQFQKLRFHHRLTHFVLRREGMGPCGSGFEHVTYRCEIRGSAHSTTGKKRGSRGQQQNLRNWVWAFLSSPNGAQAVYELILS